MSCAWKRRVASWNVGRAPGSATCAVTSVYGRADTAGRKTCARSMRRIPAPAARIAAASMACDRLADVAGRSGRTASALLGDRHAGRR